MACSKYEYVKQYEQHSSLLPGTYLIVRLDGRAFTNLCLDHELEKPNDRRLINLMVHSAKQLMHEFPDIFLAYGQSD
jgi:tRNA(His) guanylyltransferase